MFNWINDEHEVQWQGQQGPDTTGIWMWSEIFTYDYESGEKVAIILLDAQEKFDRSVNMKDCIATFAISIMLSSVQVYNVQHDIEEDNLQLLDHFTEYAHLVTDQTRDKPFQDLLFLVRDWPYTDNFGYGYAPKYIEQIMAENNKQTQAMKQLRNRIKSSFQTIDAFLMPRPARNEITSMDCLRPNFMKEVKVVMPLIFAPENLKVKQINGQKIRTQDFITYLQAYVDVFNGNLLPEPKAVFMV